MKKKILGLFLSLSLLAGSVSAINNPFAGAGAAISNRTPDCVKKAGRELYNWRGTVGAGFAILAGVLFWRNRSLINDYNNLHGIYLSISEDKRELEKQYRALQKDYEKVFFSEGFQEVVCRTVENQMRDFKCKNCNVRKIEADHTPLHAAGKSRLKKVRFNKRLKRCGDKLESFDEGDKLESFDERVTSFDPNNPLSSKFLD